MPEDTRTPDSSHPPTGPLAAALVAAGLGCLALGLITSLAEALPPLKDLLNWWDPAGPLVGKTSVAVILWLGAWGLLHHRWRYRAVPFRRAYGVTLVLIGLGLVGTFPLFFERLAAG